MRRRARERQEKKEERQEKKEKRRPVLKKLCAALLRSFRGQHGEKMVCVRKVPGVSGTLGKDDNHFDPIQTPLEIALRR